MPQISLQLRCSAALLYLFGSRYELNSGDDGTAVIGLTREQVIQRVYRARRQHYGGDIHGVIEAVPFRHVTGTSMNFFLFQHVYMEGAKVERIIGWAHPVLLQLLMYKNITMYIDGTFRSVPSNFFQCVVVMVHDEASGLFVPVAFLLYTSKKQDIYWHMLHHLICATDNKLKPETIVCDFEQGLIDAVMVQFPEADVVGCYFHFKQACRRKMKKLSIPDPEVKIAMTKGVLDMLTVIKQQHISTSGIAYVKVTMKAKCKDKNIPYSTDKWETWWVYFRATWLKRFEPHLWNISELDREIVGRTNNPLERFNRALNGEFEGPHPTIPRFVQGIDSISRKNVQLLADVAQKRAATRRRYRQRPEPVNLPDPVDLPSDDDSDSNAHERSVSDAHERY